MPSEATLGVHIIGDSRSLQAALGEASAATEKFSAGYKAQFAEMDAATLRLTVAQDKLAVATAKYGVESRGAAQAALAYRSAVEQQANAHVASMQKTGRALTTYVTAPMAIATYEAAKMGVEFNRQMLLIQTQAGASAAEVKRLTGAVLALAPAVGMGPTQLAQGLYHLESLGLRGGKAMQTLKMSALAAGMGIANLEDTATALGGVVVTGIRGAQNYQQAMGTLTATVGAGNMRFEDLATAIGNVAPAAAAAGVTLPELGAALATLTDRGMSADMAATRLRMTFALIQAPSKKAEKALKDMGINASELGGMLRQPGGLLTVLQTLHDAVNRLGATRGNRDLLAAFGGGRSGLGIQTLVQSLNSSVSSYAQKITQINGQQKDFGRNVQAYMASPSFKLHQALATLETDLTKIGMDLLPTIAKGADAVKKFADAFAALPKPAKDAIGLIVAELAIGGPLLIAIAGVTRAVQTLRATFGLLPAAAGPAAAEAGAEVSAGVGAGVATAEARVMALRVALLGLGALAIAPIVIPIVESIVKAGQQGGADLGVPGLGAQRGGKTTPIGVPYSLSAYGYKFSSDTGFAFDVKGKGGEETQLLVTEIRSNGAFKTSDGKWHRGTAQTRAIFGSEDHRLRRGGVHAPDTRLRRGSGIPTGPVLNHPPSTAAVKGYHPSEVAQLNLALAKNPNDRAAIEAKLAYDRRAAAFAEARIAAGRGSKNLVEQLKGVYGDENALEGQLAAMAKQHADAVKKHVQERQKANKTLEEPLRLQLLQAKADASGLDSKQKQAAKALKAWAEKMLETQKLTTQQQISAYELIARANQALGTQAQHAANYVVASTHKLTAGLGLSRSQRVALEQRYAQAEAHNGRVPFGVGANGMAVTITVSGAGNPDVVARRVIKHLQAWQKGAVMQTRGRHGGVALIP